MEALWSFLCDLMVWLSLPVLAAAGIWEAQLAVTETTHTLLRLLGVAVAYAWIWVWVSAGTACRLQAKDRRLQDGEELFRSPAGSGYLADPGSLERPSQPEGIRSGRRSHAGR